MGRCEGFFGGLKFTVLGFFGKKILASIFSGTLKE